MPKKFLPVYIVAGAGVAVLLLVAYLSTHNVAILNPKGTIAYQERNLIFTAVALMLIIVIPMLSVAYFFAWRYRAGNKRGHYQPEGDESLKGGIIWWVIPSLVVLGLIVVLWRGAHALDPHKPLNAPGVKPLTIQVVALNWKWLFIYPEQHIATVNFVEFPEGTPVNFELTADAPMNSFWIPQLGGQMYAMPGMENQLHLMADGPGEYNGSAAEINGQGFAGMKFVAKSGTQADFDAWVASVKQSTASLTWDEYNKLAEPSENNPRAFYSSVDSDLYYKIIMKYMVPASTGTDQVMPDMPGMHM
jgi:cytochrome o ubiquinol oxidase subunit II